LKPGKNNSNIIAWRLATLAWAIWIFGMSTASFGDQQSRSMLARILSFQPLNVSEPTLNLLNALSRKVGHLSEYAVLCFLIYQSLADATGWRWHPRRAVWSLALAAAYSLTDEFHQIFVPGRHASLFDCGIDTIGAAIAMLLVYAVSRLHDIKATDARPSVAARTQ
jgi:VanZ family protein